MTIIPYNTCKILYATITAWNVSVVHNIMLSSWVLLVENDVGEEPVVHPPREVWVKGLQNVVHLVTGDVDATLSQDGAEL